MTKPHNQINDSALCLEVAARLVGEGGPSDIVSALRLLGHDQPAVVRRIQKRFKAHGSVYRDIVADASARRIAGVMGPKKAVAAQKAAFQRRSA